MAVATQRALIEAWAVELVRDFNTDAKCVAVDPSRPKYDVSKAFKVPSPPCCPPAPDER